MTASSLKPQLRHALLRKLNAKQSGKKNWLQKGFTLVELMIVIVIVGILSAIALPNFLSQTAKAKITEPLGKVSAGLKQAQSVWVETGTFSDVGCNDVGFTGTDSTVDGVTTTTFTENNWTYTCNPIDSGESFQIEVKGTSDTPTRNLGLSKCAISGPTGIITPCVKDIDASS